MSRIIVKNLPKKVTAKRVNKIFSSKGEITDLQLKYRKDGVFRQFAIIGFKTVEQAKDAKEYFDGSFFDASKIQVEICTDFGDPLNLEGVIKDKKDKPGKEKEKHKSKYQKMLDELVIPKNYTSAEHLSPSNQRLEQHKDDIRRCRTSTALSNLAYKTRTSPDWNGAMLVYPAEKRIRQIFLESIFTRLFKSLSCNKKD